MELVDVKTCHRCKRLFRASDSQEICPSCGPEIEAMFKVVRDFVRANKRAGIEVVAEECNVSVKQVLKWVREERLMFSEESDIGVNCLVCGTIIRTGKYCVVCKKKMVSELGGEPVIREDDIGDIAVKKTRMHLARTRR